jgi:hypothetical protein
LEDSREISAAFAPKTRIKIGPAEFEQEGNMPDRTYEIVQKVIIAGVTIAVTAALAAVAGAICRRK